MFPYGLQEVFSIGFEPIEDYAPLDNKRVEARKWIGTGGRGEEEVSNLWVYPVSKLWATLNAA
jgi:hypothetical protein